MSQARICVELPTGQWKADVTRTFPSKSVYLRSWVVSDDTTTETVVLSEEPCMNVLCSIQSHSSIESSAVIHQCEQEVLLQIESSESAVLTTANRAATPLSHPIELSDGTAVIDIVGTHERIKQFGSQLTEAGLTFDISSLQGSRESNHVLTQRQQEFVTTAVELGYYRTPRQCTLTELATEMDVAKSTCSSTLHRAEEAIVEYFLSEQSTSSHSGSVPESRLQSLS